MSGSGSHESRSDRGVLLETSVPTSVEGEEVLGRVGELCMVATRMRGTLIAGSAAESLSHKAGSSFASLGVVGTVGNVRVGLVLVVTFSMILALTRFVVVAVRLLGRFFFLIFCVSPVCVGPVSGNSLGPDQSGRPIKSGNDTLSTS
jgi:hypothetical protein